MRLTRRTSSRPLTRRARSGSVGEGSLRPQASGRFRRGEGLRMGLCLHVFGPADGDDDPEEVAECDVGHYSDFGCFRDTIARHLDAGRFPTLMEHSDCDGEWSLAEVPVLERELREIGAEFRKLPPEEPQGAFEHTAEHRAGA